MKETDTETEANKRHAFYESSIQETKSMYSNEEYDMASQTTETLDKPNETHPALQECNSECSNCLYVKEDKLYISLLMDTSSVNMATVMNKYCHTVHSV